MRRPPTLIALATACLLGTPALAQFDADGALMRSYTNTLINTQVRERLLGIDSSRQSKKPAGRNGPQAGSPAQRPRASAHAAAPGGNTRYTSSPAVKARVRAQFLALVRRTSGEAAARAVGASMAQHDPLALWASHNAIDGMRLGDVADVMAEYWAMQWQMANRIESVEPVKVQGVRRMMAAALLSSPGFPTLSDAQRQEMAENLIYNQLLQGDAYVLAAKRGDPSLMRQVSDAAAARFRANLGMDPRALAITPAGFAPRR